MENIDILSKIGLEASEIKIYSSLLKYGPLTVAGLALRTRIQRPTIYKYLPLLIEKGLLSVSFKGKRKTYVAESPEKIRYILKGLEHDVEETVLRLKSIYETRGVQPIISFSEGPKAISALFEDVVMTLKRGEVFYRYSSPADLGKVNKYLPKDYREKRDKKQLERFVITTESIAEQKKPRLERDVRTLPSNEFISKNVTKLIYGNKIALIDYNNETVLTIENEHLAEFEKMTFRALYKRLS